MATQSPAFIIADAHCVYRCGLTTFLTQHFKGCTITEVTNAGDLFAAAQHHWYDMVLMNVHLPPNGFETARELKQLYADCCLVLYSSEENEQLKMCAYNCGAVSFFYARETAAAIIACIEEVLEKGFSINAESFRAYQREHKRIAESAKVALTQREKEVLYFIQKGFTNKQIAAQIFVSAKTVENHRHHLMHKTNCHNTAQLLMYVRENGL